MKNKHTIIILLCLILASCGEDRRKEYAEITAPDKWIESVVRENYYWYKEMPAAKSLNYFTEPAAFFKKLLSGKDKSSRLENPGDMENLNSYGIKYHAQLYNDTAYALKVLHVDSDSPAREAGLERGDWIIKRNNQYILKNRVDSLYKGRTITLTRGEYEIIQDENGKDIDSFKDKDTIEMNAARMTGDNPVHFQRTYRIGSKTVGYLAYNSFTPGKNTGDETYDNTLRTISNAFSGNIDAMILDLRYNTGGELKSAQLLGSILAPQQALENPMCHLRYSDKQAALRDTTWMFGKDVLGSGSNLNLTRLYVITGSGTASTSEVLINSLKAYMDVILIGQTTKGVFAGTHAYTGEYPYTLHIADCMIHNANNHLPTSGYTPAYNINELAYVQTYPIGSTDELLLYATLYLIETGDIPEALKSKK